MDLSFCEIMQSECTYHGTDANAYANKANRNKSKRARTDQSSEGYANTAGVCLLLRIRQHFGTLLDVACIRDQLEWR